MAAETGLRQRKRQQTRRHIYETARRLFGERGFEAVTVAEIARAAEFSEVTVFNYFPTKEDLFFAGMRFFEEELLAAVRDRAPGQSALAAFRQLVVLGCDVLGDRTRQAAIAEAAALIDASPTLRAREREIVARYADELAGLLAEQAGTGPDDPEAHAVASALMGGHRALVGYIRAGVLRGRRGDDSLSTSLADDARAHAERVFARLEHGLADYATGKGQPGHG